MIIQGIKRRKIGFQKPPYGKREQKIPNPFFYLKCLIAGKNMLEAHCIYCFNVN